MKPREEAERSVDPARTARAAAELQAEVVGPEAIYAQTVDVLARWESVLDRLERDPMSLVVSGTEIKE